MDLSNVHLIALASSSMPIILNHKSYWRKVRKVMRQQQVSGKLPEVPTERGGRFAGRSGSMAKSQEQM